MYMLMLIIFIRFFTANVLPFLFFENINFNVISKFDFWFGIISYLFFVLGFFAINTLCCIYSKDKAVVISTDKIIKSLVFWRNIKPLEIKYKDIYGYEFLFSTVLIYIDNLYLGRLRLELGHKNRKLFKKLVDENKKL